MTNLSLDDAEARLPLFRSIAIELQDRVEELQGLTGTHDVQSLGDARRIRDRVKECVDELQELGAEVDGFRPVSLLIPVREAEDVEERFLTWEMGSSRFTLLV